MVRFPISEHAFWPREMPQSEEQPHDSFIVGGPWKNIAQLARAFRNAPQQS